MNGSISPSSQSIDSLSVKVTCEQGIQVSFDKQQNATPVAKKTAGFLDPGFHDKLPNMFMGTDMFRDLEKSIADQTKMLDDMMAKDKADREAHEKAKLTEHIPGPLKNEGRDLASIWKLIDNLVNYTHYEETADESTLKKADLKHIDAAGYTCLASHAIGAWLSTLDRPHLDHLSTRILSDTSLWISRIWRFQKSASYFHDDQWKGILGVSRVALAEKYPKLLTDGFQALYSKPPVIYLSTAAPHGLAQFLGTQLMLPTSSVCLVPNSFNQGGDECIDVAAFDQMVSSDLSVGKSPLLLLAYAGTRVTGTLDDLAKLAMTCKTHKIWLHVEGMKLAQLALLSVPQSVMGTSTRVDSMTLDIGAWLGVPAVPYVTQYRSSLDEALLKDLSVTNSSDDSTRLPVFPLWVAMQTMGHDGIVQRIKRSNTMVGHLIQLLKTVSTIEVIKRDKVKKKPDSREQGGLGNVIGTLLSYLIHPLTTDPVVCFRFNRTLNDKVPDPPVKKVAPYANKKGQTPPPAPIKTPKFIDSHENRYYTALNQWLCETLQTNFPSMGLIPIEIAGIGVCIRYCPLETVHLKEATTKDLDDFVSKLRLHLSILTATMTKRIDFREIIMAQDQLSLVELNDWAGLGAIFYLPHSCRTASLADLPPDALDDLCSINRDLVHKLRSEDGAFSLGCLHLESSIVDAGDQNPSHIQVRELYCVRFGLITEDTDIEELIGMVLAMAIECEEASKYLEKMAELVKAGIATASKDLIKEHEEKMRQEGILRQVPILDSFVNWWSPPSKEMSKGRTLNLSSGQVQSTEDTYRYKMQLNTISTPNSTPLGSLTARPSSHPRAAPAAAFDPSTAPVAPEDVENAVSYKSLLKPRVASTTAGGEVNGSIVPLSPAPVKEAVNMNNNSINSFPGDTAATFQSHRSSMMHQRERTVSQSSSLAAELQGGSTALLSGAGTGPVLKLTTNEERDA